MDYNIIYALVIAIALKAANVFKWRSAILYFLFSVILTYAAGIENAPNMILTHTFEIFAAYVVFGIIKHRINCAKNRQRTFSMNASYTSLLFIFLLGYSLALLNITSNISFIITMVLYFTTGLQQLQKHKSILKIALIVSITHAILFSGGKTLLQPMYNVAAYIIITALLSEVRAAFSTACAPENLREGMMLAESIEHDGKNYVFRTHPYPSIMSIVRYVVGDVTRKRRVIASVFTALESHQIAELQQVAKTQNKKTFLVQKKIDLLPFIFLGAIMVYAVGA